DQIVEIYIPSVNVSETIFNTCPLILYNHLDSQLLRFHYPGYNPKINCTPYESFTTLRKGRVYPTSKAKGYQCQARCLYNDHDKSYISTPWMKIPSNNSFECDIIESECTFGTFFRRTESYIHMQIYEKN
ncbi:hypothetical protein OSTOST_02404, partial [Ostertagia ostertagi]